MYEAFTDYVAFNHIVGIRNVGELNSAVDAGESSTVINVSEALHGNRIAAIADEITRRFRKGEAKVVLIAGPSSSGKTTFSKRLAIQLMTNLVKPQTISLDDYFVDVAVEFFEVECIERFVIIFSRLVLGSLLAINEVVVK